jgi:hypothetical protein
MQETEIAIFQESLLEILSSQVEPTQILTTLEKSSKSDTMSKYVSTFDPRMVQLAADLVKQWGRRYRDRIVCEDSDIDESEQFPQQAEPSSIGSRFEACQPSDHSIKD